MDPARAAGRWCHLPSLWVWPGAGGAPWAAGKVLQQNPGEVRCHQVGWGLTPSGKEGACRGPGPPLFPLQLETCSRPGGLPGTFSGGVTRGTSYPMAPISPVKCPHPSSHPSIFRPCPLGSPHQAARWLLSSFAHLAHSPPTPLTFPDVASKGPGGCWQGLGVLGDQGPVLCCPCPALDCLHIIEPH